MSKSTKKPSYLTRNGVGTYVFQVRVPTHIQRLQDHPKPLVRCSLRTKDYQEAIRRGWQKWLLFDRAIHQYANSQTFRNQIEQIVAGDWSIFNQSGFKLPATVYDNQTPTAYSQTAPPLPSHQNPTVGKLVQDFMFHKKNTGARAASLKWYQQKVQQFADVLTALNGGNVLTVGSISVDLMRQYASVMHRYPKHANTRKLTKSMSEQERVRLVMSSDRDSLSSMGIEPMGFQTIGHNFTAVRELLRYGERQQLPVSKGLDQIIPSNKKKRGSKPQVKFNDDDLKTLFNSAEYRTGSFERASDYWIPLLALFGGETQAELCQLHVSDVRRLGEIWYIDINDQDEKLLKTEAGRPRQVPIHQQLIELGFLEFVAQCQQQGLDRLFPTEDRDQNDKFPSYSKRFNRWRKRLGIVVDSNGGRKTFHSFRHLVSDWLIGNQCHPGVAADIIGHEGRERLETRRTYSDGAWLIEKDAWIQRLSYTIDWSVVRCWGDVAINTEQPASISTDKPYGSRHDGRRD